MKYNRLEPLPKDPNGQRLCEIFGQYRWQTLEGSTADTTEPNWRTITNYPLRPRALWAKWQDAAKLVGVRFGDKTCYGLIDLDAKGPYCTPEAINQINAALETIGIVRTIPIRSSWSGGVHLYIPLPEQVSTFSLAVALKSCLEAQGITVRQSHCEIFPNVKAFTYSWLGSFSEYNGHRLPLQPGSGSCMLTPSLQPIGATLERFFWAWDFAADAQDMGELNHALKIGRANHRKRGKATRTHPVESWRQDLELEANEGWSGPGQTNHLLKTIATLGRVFERLEGAELADYVYEQAITRPGYERWCRHQHDIKMRCVTWARAVEKYYYPLGGPNTRLGTFVAMVKSHNDRIAEEARQRIQSAMEYLRSEGTLPDAIGERAFALARVAHCALRTLYKNRSLWHPCYMGGKNATDPASTATEPEATPPEPPPSPPPETAQNQDFSDTGRLMKGVGVTDSPKNTYPQGRGGVVGGERGFFNSG